MAKAVATSGERKKIQVMQTKLKVTKMLTYRPQGVGGVCPVFSDEGSERYGGR